MDHPRKLAALAVASLTFLAVGTAAEAKTVFGILPAPGILSEEQMPQGPLHFSAGTQTLMGRSSVVSLDFAGVFEKGELVTRLAFNPEDITTFMAADVYGNVVGQTGSFLPINLMPVMGIGVGMYLLSPPGSTDPLDVDAVTPIYVPMGLRYVQPLGDLSLGVSALYFHQLLDYASNRNQADISRWRYEASLRWGFLSASAYTEQGPSLSGPGFKLGINF